MSPLDKLIEYIRKRHETNQSFENLVTSLKQEEKKQMIGFHRWMLKQDTMDNAEQYFHFTDDDMANEYLREVSPQDPAVYKRTNITTIEDQMNLYREIEEKEREDIEKMILDTAIQRAKEELERARADYKRKSI